MVIRVMMVMMTMDPHRFSLTVLVHSNHQNACEFYFFPNMNIYYILFLPILLWIFLVVRNIPKSFIQRKLSCFNLMTGFALSKHWCAVFWVCKQLIKAMLNFGSAGVLGLLPGLHLFPPEQGQIQQKRPPAETTHFIGLVKIKRILKLLSSNSDVHFNFVYDKLNFWSY